MGVDTHVRLKGRFYYEDILDYVKNNFDENATGKKTVSKTQMYSDDDIVYDKSFERHTAYIDFKYKGEQRCLHYYYNSVNSLENLEYYKNNNLEDLVRSETTFLCVGYWGLAEEIMTKIIECFGGWIDINDCDDDVYVWVEPNGTYKPVKEVTMQEVYEKFGETVRIV